MSYSLQRPVDEHGAPIIGPQGRPIIIPHFQIPAWIVFDYQVDARALGAYAFLCAFLDPAEGEVSSSVTATDVATRFGVTEQVVMRKGGRKNNPPGLMWRLAEANALIVGPGVVKTRDCAGCQTPVDVPCPPECSETKGRKRVKPRFELAQQPPQGFLYEGPMSRWEYHSSKLIAKRLREEAPDSGIPARERRRVVPFVQVLAWPAFDTTLDLLHLGVYVFLVAHTSLADGVMSTGDDLYREVIGRRFALSASRVSAITRHLEERRFIAKRGLLRAQDGHRHGMSGEATSYMVQVLPPAGLMHPQPLRVSEWRAPERITERQEAVRKDPSVCLQFPHTLSELGIVDNSRHPQTSGCGTERLGVWEREGVDVETGDLNTHPLTHPETHPSPSVGAQPQGRDTVPRGLASSGGDKGSREGGRSQPGVPAAAQAGLDLLALVASHVPRSLCRNGRADQEMLAARLGVVLEYGFTFEEIQLVFDGITPETVLNPFAVVADRIKSVSRLREHLAKVAERRAAVTEVPGPRVPSVGRCGVHGTEYVPELSTLEVPFCLLCDREFREEAKEVGSRAITDGGSEYSISENVHEPETEDLDPAVLASRAQESLASARQAHRAPGLNLATVLDEMLPAPEREYCGRCQQEGRYILVPSATSPDGYERRRCPRCG